MADGAAQSEARHRREPGHLPDHRHSQRLNTTWNASPYMDMMSDVLQTIIYMECIMILIIIVIGDLYRRGPGHLPNHRHSQSLNTTWNASPYMDMMSDVLQTIIYNPNNNSPPRSQSPSRPPPLPAPQHNMERLTI